MKLHEAFSPEESKKIYDNFLAIVNDPKRRDRLVRKHGKNAENVAYGTAVNQVKRQAANTIEEPQPEETMEDTRLREMVIDALTEKSKPKARPDYPDIDKDGDREESMKKAAQDKKKMQMEDLDLGHQDDEPHMLKADLYRIGKYAMELYKMVDQFEGEQEVDFPHWWQSKIVQAKSMLVSAKHYLDFETKEPQIDAMVDVASEEGAIGEEMTPEKSEKIGMPFKGIAKEGEIDEMSKKQIKKRGKVFDALKDQGMPDKKAGPIATSVAMKEEIKKAILAKLKESKGEYAKIEKQIADLKSKGKNAGDVEMQKLIKRRAELEKSKK
jgi:hypothetical protein